MADTVQVHVSCAQARQRFHGCTPEYIKEVCHAACCKSSTGHPRMVVLPDEATDLQARYGAPISLDPPQLLPVVHSNGHVKCQFHDTASDLCKLHALGEKPFTCTVSPFALNKNDLLVVRNRYRLLRCYNVEPRLPAYVAFRSSLDLLFGDDEAGRVCLALDRGAEGALPAHMPAVQYARLQLAGELRARATEVARERGEAGLRAAR